MERLLDTDDDNTNYRKKTRKTKFVPNKVFGKRDMLLANHISRHIRDMEAMDEYNHISLRSEKHLRSNCTLKPVFAFSLDICDMEMVVLLDRQFIGSALAPEYSYEIFSKLPVEFKMALISPLVNRFVNSIPPIKGKGVKIDTRVISGSNNYKYDVYWDMAAYKNDMHAGNVTLCLTYDGVDELLGSIPDVINADRGLMSRTDFPIFGQLYIGALVLKRRDVSTVSVGDVLISDVRIRKNTVSLRFSESLSFSCSVNNMKLKVNGVGDPIMRATKNRSSQVRENDVDNVSIDDMNISLTLDIGHIRIPLSEVVSLKPGCVIEMPESYEKKVNIRNHDKLVATGELVQVGENLGVEIREIRYGVS